MELIDYAITKLTEILIKENFKEKKTGKTTYVKKKRAYKDIIQLLEDIKSWEEKWKKIY